MKDLLAQLASVWKYPAKQNAWPKNPNSWVFWLHADDAVHIDPDAPDSGQCAILAMALRQDMEAHGFTWTLQRQNDTYCFSLTKPNHTRMPYESTVAATEFGAVAVTYVRWKNW
jgi:hypothetical protein